MVWRNRNKQKEKKLALLSHSETSQKHKDYLKQNKCNYAKNQGLQNPYRNDQYFRFHVFFFPCWKEETGNRNRMIQCNSTKNI